jgi:arylsulfatase A-like enzyme
VAEADRLAGEVLNGLDEAGLSQQTIILVTADQGGKGKDHGGATMAEIEIPWIMRGLGVRPGKIAAPANTHDTAATVAFILGLTPPDCWIARPVRKAFTPN